MNSSRTLRGGLAAFFILCLSAAAATIKVKSGAVHEGKVNGLIVLKGQEKETPSEADPSKTVYSASYAVINGSDITAIDAKGVHSGQPAALLTVTQDDVPLDDLDVVRNGLKISPVPFSAGVTKAGGNIVRVGVGQAAPSRDSVLGEYREQKDTNQSELRPVIEIETAKGVVTVPIADLIPLAPE